MFALNINGDVNTAIINAFECDVIWPASYKINFRITVWLTGLCGKKQKEISKAIKRAQQMGKRIWKFENI